LEALGAEDVPVDAAAAALLTAAVASNAWRHGQEPLEVSVAIEDHGVRVSVFDRGQAFDPADPAIRRRGAGINLLDRLSSEWGVEPKDNGRRSGSVSSPRRLDARPRYGPDAWPPSSGG
jgi:hypothetical protein